MKRIFSATALLLALSMSTVASANNSIDHIISNANDLRSASHAVNSYAAGLEAKIRYLISCNQPVPYALKQLSLHARYKARDLAVASNVVAREAFLSGYIRHAH